MSANDLRRELACADELTFLNYAATAPLLRSSAEVMVRLSREATRPMAEHFESWLAQVESARRSVAETIGARADEITFTTNTSAALSLVAGAVRWRTGDRVLYPADEFPSNRFVWDNLRELGVEAQGVPPESGRSFAAQLAERDLAGVRLVAVSHVSYRDGRVHDLPALAALCRPRDILLAVDGIQAVGALPVDVRSLGCDFLACGGQKWLLGPLGSGFLFVSRDRLEGLHVPTVGWASSRYAGEHDAPTFAWTEGAARFEGGMPDVTAIAALGASLERLRAAGWTQVYERVAHHRRALLEGCARRGLTTLCPADDGSGIVVFRPPQGRGEEIAAALERARVLVTPRHGAIRVSAHVTTSDEEIQALFHVIDGALGRPAPRASVPRAPAAASRTSTPARRWRHAVVTGASRGLGAAFAALLARRGCSLTLVGRDRPALERLAEELVASHRTRAIVAPVDLAEPHAVSQWIEHHREALLEADLLINNAAWADAAPFLDAEPGAERTAFETNALAPMALARAVLPGMLERRYGNILNVVTSGARNALPLFSSYAASKAALWAWGEALSRELEGSGVSVLSFVPPHMDTATRRQLGRRAIGFYSAVGGVSSRGLATPAQAAEAALAAAAAGQSVFVPATVRWETAINAVLPGRVRARLARAWKGVRRGDR